MPQTSDIGGTAAYRAQWERDNRASRNVRRNQRRREDRAANPELTRALDRSKREANLDAARAKNQRYYQGHRVEVIDRVRERQTKVQLSGTVTTAEWEALLLKYGNKCLCCGSTENLTKDHVIPVALGGLNVIGNIQPLCGSCNDRKGVKVIDYRG